MSLLFPRDAGEYSLKGELLRGVGRGGRGIAAEQGVGAEVRSECARGPPCWLERLLCPNRLREKRLSGRSGRSVMEVREVREVREVCQGGLSGRSGTWSMHPGSLQPGSLQPGSLQPGSLPPGSLQPGSLEPRTKH